MLSINVILIITVCVLAIIFFAFIAKQKSMMANLAEKLKLQESLLNEQSQTLSYIEQQLSSLSEVERAHFDETNEVTKQLEHRISTLKQHIASMDEQLLSIQQQSSEDKFYSRALKLAKKGADVDEIVQECEIPRAEAEMLLSVHQQKK
ncbi:DUF2802 domain-containing protein [Thalassotalea eurytherma]|uniref:DUF2802 domain-containing protein n=1 Tax=Thalassotalea eurytherma TaxID=1144278 RepID=A0ABQ6H5G7_9GAMM|nr:DUF2802 domain-containing protein [Thalassotalea eurytherma]GLX83174.1 hypothetical protein theurythT_26260 [Thalassotalea eurytherma]